MPAHPDIICLLDDEPSVLKALARLLASEGWCSERFTAPRQFLDYARGHPVRLAVIDLRMPDMSGLEVLSELQRASPGTRVIVITAEDEPEFRRAALAGGAVAFFLKPLDPDAFLDAVRVVLTP